MPTRPLLVLAASATAVAVLAGCAPSAVAPTASPSPDVRIVEIRAAREAVAEPAVELREATQILISRVETLRTEVDTDPLGRADDLLAEPAGRLRAVIGRIRDLELGGGADVREADAALQDAADAGEDLIAAAEAERAEVEELSGIDDDLAGLVAAWDQPGARSTQLAHFDDLARSADELATGLDGRSALHDCSGVLARRADAARSVAEASRELRGYVESRQGTRFDERRGELGEDPYGTGGSSLLGQDLDELGSCWRDSAAVVAAGEDVDAALAALQAALNPSDLEEPSPDA